MVDSRLAQGLVLDLDVPDSLVNPGTATREAVHKRVVGDSGVRGVHAHRHVAVDITHVPEPARERGALGPGRRDGAVIASLAPPLAQAVGVHGANGHHVQSPVEVVSSSAGGDVSPFHWPGADLERAMNWNIAALDSALPP